MRRNIVEATVGNPSGGKRGWHHEQHTNERGVTFAFYVRNGFKAVKCHGEAHNNAHIDHCMLCLNHTWGWRAELENAAPESEDSYL